MKNTIAALVVIALAGCVGLTPVPAMSGKLDESVSVRSKEPTDAKDAAGNALLSETEVDFDLKAPSGTDLEGSAVVTLEHGDWKMTVDRGGKGSTQGLADANVAIAPISAQAAQQLAAQLAPLIQAAIAGGFNFAVESMKAKAVAEANEDGTVNINDILGAFLGTPGVP